MINPITLQNYIKKCDDVIADNNLEFAKLLEKEIISVLHNYISDIENGLSLYQPCSFGDTPESQNVYSENKVDVIGDIKILRSKLQLKLEEIPLNETDLKFTDKKIKIFISHSSSDVDYVRQFVYLLEDIGLSENEVVCSSIPEYGIPLGADIYEWLSEQFQNYNLHVFFMLSNNYYKSIACLNEMGAAWVLKNKYDTILLPSFDFNQIQGAVNPRQIGIKLDSNIDELKLRLSELKDTLVQELNLKSISTARWERYRDKFISNITEIQKNEQVDEEKSKNCKTENSISKDSAVLLVYAANSEYGEITVAKSIIGTSISTKEWTFLEPDSGAREEARWNSAIEELEKFELIKSKSYKRQLFNVSHEGYKIADDFKEKFSIDTDKSPTIYLNS